MKLRWGGKLAVLAITGLMAWPLAAQEAHQNTQQERMKACNVQAADKKGDERKAFMKECLGGKETAAPQAPKTQRERMTYCNQQAADKKGDERKAFMKQCLSTKTAASEKPKDQNEKMKYCNTQAGGKKGDERKAFMSECLKNAA